MTPHIHIDEDQQTKRLRSKPRYRNMPSRLPTPPLLLTTMTMMVMMALAVAIATTPSSASAFLVDTNAATHPHHTSRPLDPMSPPPRNVCRRRTTTRTPTTRLEMAVTKSGGRPVLSEKQFRTEVLLLDDDDRPITPAAAATEPKPKPILVFYSAPWCGPCRLSNPVVKEIIRAFVPLIDVVEVCTDDLPEIAEVAGVVSIPTIQFYYEGGLLDTIVGCVAKNVLGSAVRKILEDLGCWDDQVDGDEDEEVDEDGADFRIGVG